ncbi:MAG: PrsW family intramembrane metalloprotease [Chloroflexota bacterium]|nr:PrsW family intramembrane metalloprotease [Chloroflexota bacterium]
MSESSPSRNALVLGGVWMIVLAALLLACGLCSALCYAVLPFTSQPRGSAVDSNVVFGALTGMGILLGGVFLWQGIGTLRGGWAVQAARVFPHVALFVILFLLAILCGVGALAIPSLVKGAAAEAVTAFVFPPWHFIAASVPPIALLAYAAHRLGAASGVRALLVSFGWGALGATVIAVVVELAIAAVFVIVAALAIAARPDSRALIDQFRAEVELARGTDDPAAVSKILTEPAVFAGVLLYAAVLIPLVEEALKTIAVAFVDPRRTRPADALLWGIGAGAGFALFENLFNGGATLELWAMAAFLRIGATIMHVANGATMGRGWYAARVERRWSQLLIAYLISVIYHAVWNATALSLSSSAVSVLSEQGAPLAATLPAAALALALFAVLVTLATGGVVWIVRSVRSAQASLSLQPAERSE